MKASCARAHSSTRTSSITCTLWHRTHNVHSVCWCGLTHAEESELAYKQLLQVERELPDADDDVRNELALKKARLLCDLRQYKVSSAPPHTLFFYLLFLFFFFLFSLVHSFIPSPLVQVLFYLCLSRSRSHAVLTSRKKQPFHFLVYVNLSSVRSLIYRYDAHRSHWRFWRSWARWTQCHPACTRTSPPVTFLAVPTRMLTQHAVPTRMLTQHVQTQSQTRTNANTITHKRKEIFPPFPVLFIFVFVLALHYWFYMFSFWCAGMGSMEQALEEIEKELVVEPQNFFASYWKVCVALISTRIKHTCTYKYTHEHTCTHKHIHSQARMHAQAYMHAQAHSLTSTHAHTSTQISLPHIHENWRTKLPKSICYWPPAFKCIGSGAVRAGPAGGGAAAIRRGAGASVAGQSARRRALRFPLLPRFPSYALFNAFASSFCCCCPCYILRVRSCAKNSTFLYPYLPPFSLSFSSSFSAVLIFFSNYLFI